MVDEIGAHCEGFLADFAEERFVLLVALEMPEETLKGGDVLIADVASNWIFVELLFVLPQVISESLLGVQRLIASDAAVPVFLIDLGDQLRMGDFVASPELLR